MSNDNRRGPMRGMRFEKPKDFKKAMRQLVTYSHKYLPLTIVAMFLAIISAIIALVGPDQIKRMTNIIAEGMLTGIDVDTISRIGLTLVILYVISFIFSYIQAYMMATITQKLSQNMRTDISIKINKLPLKYFDKTYYGDVLSRVTNDVDSIGQTLNRTISSLVSSLAMLVGSLIMMFVTNWILAFVAVGSTFFGFIFMFLVMKKSQKYFLRQQKDLGRINGHVEEIYSGHNIVKVYNAEDKARKEFEEINEALYTSNWKSQFLSGLMMPFMIFIGNFGYVAVCVVGAILAVDGSISFGVIVAFIIYVRLFSQPLSQIAQAANSLQTTAAASERVFEILSEPELADESTKDRILENVRGNVEFRNVQFGYDEDKLIIHNFNAKIKAGQKVAIVGPTGAGKTTIVNLLMRFYELNHGTIFIDNIPTNELTRDNVHDLFCMVLQDTWLFEGTIKENIAYSMKNVADEDIIKACKIVGIDHFIQTLPHGYDTVLDDKSALSAGQKQLLTIARAIVQNAPLLILDEATSSVDTRTELLIQQAMEKLTIGRTSFIIAHRLSTIKNADLILVMNNGDIVESGTHEQLLAANGFYADLYNSQFENV